MNTYPSPIVNGCNLITRQGNKLDKLYGLDNVILYLDVHKFNKYPTCNAWLDYSGPLTNKQLVQGLIFQHWMTMGKNMK